MHHIHTYRFIGTHKSQRRYQMEAEEAGREMERREKQAFAEAMQAKEQTSKFLKQTMQEYVVLKNSNI